MDELRIFSEAIKALLSTSANGAAILRVLQALSSFVTSSTEKENDGVSRAHFEFSEINSALEPLWHELSCCISKIESYSEPASEIFTPSTTSVSKPPNAMPPLPAGSQNILPYIESFFVVCEKLHPAQSGANNEEKLITRLMEVLITCLLLIHGNISLLSIRYIFCRHNFLQSSFGYIPSRDESFVT
jgi:E3 ubiquitin-protein ligase HUWE1